MYYVFLIGSLLLALIGFGTGVAQLFPMVPISFWCFLASLLLGIVSHQKLDSISSNKQLDWLRNGLLLQVSLVALAGVVLFMLIGPLANNTVEQANGKFSLLSRHSFREDYHVVRELSSTEADRFDQLGWATLSLFLLFFFLVTYSQRVRKKS